MGALPVMVEDAQDLRGTVMRPEGVTVAAGRSFAIDLTPRFPPPTAVTPGPPSPYPARS